MPILHTTRFGLTSTNPSGASKSLGYDGSVAFAAAGMSSIGVKAFLTELFTGVLLLVVILLEFAISKAVAYRASLQRRLPHLAVA